MTEPSTTGSASEAQIDEWIRECAYAPDDIVLGTAGLTDDQLEDLHKLLDLVRPGWRSIFDEAT